MNSQYESEDFDMQYGLQLYSVRDLAKENFEQALKQVAEMGYTMVETVSGKVQGSYHYSPPYCLFLLSACRCV